MVLTTGHSTQQLTPGPQLPKMAFTMIIQSISRPHQANLSLRMNQRPNGQHLLAKAVLLLAKAVLLPKVLPKAHVTAL